MKKKHIKYIIIILSFIVTAIYTVSGLECGDVNNSALVDIVDALLIAQCYVGLRECPANNIGDVDCSGSINIIDALHIARYYVALVDSLGCCSQVFPYRPHEYSYGLNSVSEDQIADNDLIGDTCMEYELWKQNYVTSQGAGGFWRIKDPKGHVENWTTSQAIGFGMLLAVYMDDIALFEGLWNYVQIHLTNDPSLPSYPGGTDSGLMIWAIEPTGVAFDDFMGEPFHSATGPDIDIATALILASKKWGLYDTEAKTYLSNILRCEIDTDTYILKPNDFSTIPFDTINPSYFTLASLRIFEDFDFANANTWKNVIDKCYEILSLAAHVETGLVPDWCDASGDAGHNPHYPPHQTEFHYEAIKSLYNISLDFAWYGDTRSFDFCSKVSDFFETQKDSQNRIRIWNGYALDGQITGIGEDIAFAGASGVAAMAVSRESYAREVLARVKDFKMNQYYQDTLRLFSLLRLTGNYPNLYNYYKSPIPTPVPNPINPSPCPTQPPPLTCSADPQPTPQPAECPLDNLVSYGCFNDEGDINNWLLINYLDGRGTLSCSDGSAYIEVLNPGTQEWCVQVTQSGINMIKGTTYILSFDARADVLARPIDINISQGVVPYESYSGEYRTKPELSCDWQHYEIIFTPILESNDNTRFEINVGRHLGGVYLDNIILVISP